MIQTVSAYLRVWKFEASFQTATSSPLVIRIWMAQCDLISRILVTLYVNDIPPPSHHVELVLYPNDMAIRRTFRIPMLLVSYLESHLSYLQWSLNIWSIAINVSNSTTIIFAKDGRRYNKPRSLTLFREPVQWVYTTRYLDVSPHTRLIWSPHNYRVKKKTVQRMGILGHF